MTALPQRLLCRNDCPVWLRGGTSSYSEECTARQKLEETLRSTFHHASFRPGQLEALLPVAHGQDVLVRMPTGGGKSLCMFLIPLSLGKAAMGIVISPLVGLIEQQVSSGICLGIMPMIIVLLCIGISAHVFWSVCYSCIPHRTHVRRKVRKIFIWFVLCLHPLK